MPLFLPAPTVHRLPIVYPSPPLCYPPSQAAYSLSLSLLFSSSVLKPQHHCSLIVVSPSFIYLHAPSTFSISPLLPDIVSIFPCHCLSSRPPLAHCKSPYQLRDNSLLTLILSFRQLCVLKLKPQPPSAITAHTSSHIVPLCFL